MKNENSEPLHSIVEAGIGKRLGAAILDGLVAIFLWLFLAMIVMTPIANAGLGYSANMNLGYQYQIASHLYVYQQQDDNGDISIVEVKDMTEKIDANKESQISSLTKQTNLEPAYLLSHLYYYYSSFLTGENVELPNPTSSKTYDMVEDHFVSPDYLDNVVDTQLKPAEYYTVKWFNNEILSVSDKGADYFDNTDENILATIKEGVDADKAITFLNSLISNAQGDLYYRDYYVKINNTIKWNQAFIIIPPYISVMGILYLLIPMLSKNGETIGKKFCHLAVISKDGYSAKKRQILFRFFVFFVEISLSLFAIGVNFTSIATLGVGVFILLMATLISKSHRAPHDYAALTLEIDAQKSVWFDSPEIEQRHIDELEAKMERYKSSKVENKNIIQIGGKIIDEDLKKQVEEAQAKEKVK
jgi:uncharacterized RDD family membrane protein YckC